MSSPVLKSWVAFAAIGTALIHLALVIGAPTPLAIVLGILGVVEFGWGIVTLSRQQIVFPGVARAAALAPVLLWSILTVLSTALDDPQIASALSFIPLAVATLFELFIVIAITVQLRRNPPQSSPGTRQLLGMIAAALVVAGLTAPALAFTQAGPADSNSRPDFGDIGHAGH